MEDIFGAGLRKKVNGGICWEPGNGNIPKILSMKSRIMYITLMKKVGWLQDGARSMAYGIICEAGELFSEMSFLKMKQVICFMPMQMAP